MLCWRCWDVAHTSGIIFRYRASSSISYIVEVSASHMYSCVLTLFERLFLDRRVRFNAAEAYLQRFNEQPAP